jgi:hypothetical protein
MATTALVENRDIEIGRRVIGALTRSGIGVNVAFWAHIPQISEWQLFIATPLVDSKGERSAYEEVLRTLRNAGIDADLPWRRIFLRSPKDPVLKSLERQTKSYKGSIEIVESENTSRGTPSAYYVTYAPYPAEALRFLNVAIGDRFVEDAYVYPASWLVTGLGHLKQLLSKLHISQDVMQSAFKDLSAEKRALILNVQVGVRDVRRLNPA